MTINESRNLLVTGANGCIGAWVLDGALRQGWNIVALDLSLDITRPRLLLAAAELARVTWRTCDIADTNAVFQVFDEHAIDAVIHLGALQVPFCKADPVKGAQVNVVGTVNLLESVRQRGIQRFAFASSVAIHGDPDPSNPYLGTLYGAYKKCTETTAAVYWQDWRVPSVCIRPGLVYGVGRDQGMTSATTKAILAAAADRAYTIPFSGDIPHLYVREVAGAFLQAVAADRADCHIFDLNGRHSTIDRLLELIGSAFPNAQVDAQGEPLPFPADLSDEPIQSLLGDYGITSLEDGFAETVVRFKDLLARGMIDLKQLDN